ncbi:MAG: MlaD family protein [Tannerellaceae bacterium]|jgi:phospholipid/cholesterol/gamma-HCH transport system substrate-binding protein|nr:MlaD family protein [Tannerellaceae bacterium]
MSYFSKEIKIGIATVASLVLLYVGVNYLKGINLFHPSNYYYVTFANVKDLTVSTPVFIDGFKVGLVRSLQYDYEQQGKISVEIHLDDELKIPKGSYVVLVHTLLSGAELHIHPNTYLTTTLESGDTIEGRIGEDMLTTVQNELLPNIETLFTRLDSILASLQTVINHPALSQSLEHIERTTNNLEASAGVLNALLEKDVPVILGNLRTTTDNFNLVSSRLRDMDFAATLHSVDLTLANLKTTTDKLNSKNNTLGSLLNDNSLYENLNQTSLYAADLLLDLRERPKRYVHFSLF